MLLPSGRGCALIALVPMSKIKQSAVKLSNVQIDYLKERMDHFAQRNPSTGINPLGQSP